MKISSRKTSTLLNIGTPPLPYRKRRPPAYLLFIIAVFNLVWNTAAQTKDITLNWNDNSDNEDGFIIERSTDGAPFIEIARTKENVNTYIDSSSQADTPYTYRVKAFNVSGTSNYTNQASLRLQSQTAYYIGRIEGIIEGECVIELLNGKTINIVAISPLGITTETTTVDIDSTGFFTLSSNLLGDCNGRAIGSQITGNSLDNTITFSATKTLSESKPNLPSPGFYSSIIADTPDGLLKTFVLPNGTAIAALTLNGSSHWLPFELDSKNEGSTTLPTGETIELTYSPSKFAFTGVLKSDGNKDKAILGINNKSSANGELAPTSITIHTTDNNETTITWSDNQTNEYGYVIERSIDGNTFQTIANVEANATSYTAPTIILDTPISYRVRAFNQTGFSAYSNISNIRIQSDEAYYVGQLDGIIAGKFAIEISKGTDTKLLLQTSEGTLFETTPIEIDSNGHFTFDSPSLGSISGRITNSNLSGTTLDGQHSFSGTKSQPANDNSEVPIGFYKAAIDLSSDGFLRILKLPDHTSIIALTYDNKHYWSQLPSNQSASLETTLTSNKSLELNYSETSSTFFGTFHSQNTELSISGIGNFSSSQNLANISIRAKASSNEKTMIAGVTIAGPNTLTALIRGVGPSLKNFGVTNILEDPTLTIYQFGKESPISFNDNWTSSEQINEIIKASDESGAFPLDNGSLDAATLSALTQGAYTAHISGANQTEGTALFELYAPDQGTNTSPNAYISNLSMRGEIGSGDETTIIGFVIQGTTPQKVLIRAIGQELKDFGILDTLDEPQILLFKIEDNRHTLVSSNDDWENSSPSILKTELKVGAFPLQKNSGSAAIECWLAPGAYTVLASSENENSGVALVELYNIPQP